MTTQRIETHTLDATGQILGRLATETANLLRGKHKLGFTYNQDHGDRVLITNIDKIRLTGRKAESKTYYRHSSYPGGLSEVSFTKLLQTKPEEVLTLAISRMLPDNRLRRHWLNRLVLQRSQAHG